MKRITLAGMALLMTPAAALAALPPQYQRQAELQAVIAQATEQFGIGHLIDSIVRTGPDNYEVSGDNCRMTLTIEDAPQDPSAAPVVGPRQFTVKAGPLVCN